MYKTTNDQIMSGVDYEAWARPPGAVGTIPSYSYAFELQEQLKNDYKYKIGNECKCENACGIESETAARNVCERH